MKRTIGRDEEQGFTLIELMVVVLIIGILLAIAIPTFLGAKNKANAKAAESTLRNALTAEKTVFVDSQSYDGTPADMTSVEGNISWLSTTAPAAGTNQVLVIVSGSGGQVNLYASSKDGNCYSIQDTGSTTSYGHVTGACTATGAAGITYGSTF